MPDLYCCQVMYHVVTVQNPPDMYPPDTYPKDIYPLDTYSLDTYPLDTYHRTHTP